MPSAQIENLPVIDRKLKLSLGLLGIAMLLLLVGVLITDKMYNAQNFKISKITLTGNAPNVDRLAVRETVIDLLEGNYFSLDTPKIVETLRTLPWVESVRLRRKWPDTLIVNIDEHQAIAHWDENSWLTAKGKLVKLPLPKNVSLPHLSGPKNQVQNVWKHYQNWSAQFSAQGLRLRSMDLSKQHVYRLQLEYVLQSTAKHQGFELIVANSNAQAQLNTFLASRRLAMLDAPERIKTVDLRYPSGFSITWYPADDLAQNQFFSPPKTQQ